MKIALSPKCQIVIGLSVVVVLAASMAGWGARAAQTAPPQHPYLRQSMSINRLMVALVDHAAHQIWDGGNSKTRLTDEQWETIEAHTYQLQAAATLVSLGGTGKSDPGWAASPAFQDWARKLNDAAVVARRAVGKKDQMALFAAGNTLVDTCEGCHKQFKPDVPTEGILHSPHYKD